MMIRSVGWFPVSWRKEDYKEKCFWKRFKLLSYNKYGSGGKLTK